MLIYRSAEREDEPRRILDAVCAAACAASVPLARQPSHDRWVELLLDVGELESAVADAEMPDRDDLTPLAGSLRRVARLLGEVVLRSWDGDRDALAAKAPALADAARSAALLPLPDRLMLRVPEGYAYYALFPETCIAAARRFADELQPRLVNVVGIRSIGTSLSAVVAAALADSGAVVRSCTLRPRGHPFEREVELGERITGMIRGAPDSWYAIVDEGPGLSGSSFTSAVDALLRLGVPEDRIVFFPSWDPDPAVLRNEAARARWPRHRKFIGDFDEVWLRSGRLTRSLGEGRIHDLSAGAWRDYVTGKGATRPAVHPQHEQRKLLFVPDDEGRAPLLLKFVGLGRYGQTRIDRARRMNADGWVPQPLALRHGFLVRRWIDGTPVAPRTAPRDLIEHVAGYLAYLRRAHPAADGPQTEVLLDMVRTNVREALGEEWLPAVKRIEPLADEVSAAPTSRCDARLLPHEFLQTADGFVKTDALSHHDDHFLPGPQHVAWDLAGASAELELDVTAQAALVDKYAEAADDPQARRILPFHRVAYLAFRTGYTTTAAEALGDSPDGKAMRERSGFYAQHLARALRDGDDAPA